MSDSPPPTARAEVVNAVKNALATHGYAGLTTKKVAAESEKSEAFFFYHYDTKDDLVVAFLDWAIEHNRDQLSALDDDPVTRLYDALDFLVGDPADDVDRGINVAMMELLSHAPHNERFHERLTAYEASVIELFVDIVEEGIARGQFEEVDAHDVASYLVVTANGTAGAAMALGMHDVDAGVRRELDRYLRTNVLAPGVTPPEGVLVP
ncbi:TetR/AcrR family transcriptional regulator [Salinigranum rubrum]|uniref:TetR/AcrR family transcriptional regulator n=1 Tax=Salinigranum rubrum TaxID=755307 RepID=A0A2I8VNL5_9EURY|nr:TetR/AcrR family transcriptional regulator [Salinigranum rubrum]AUV82699.1 TetR/AcrR family transcriptional regulator [Salinigranum rubrum]